LRNGWSCFISSWLALMFASPFLYPTPGGGDNCRKFMERRSCPCAPNFPGSDWQSSGPRCLIHFPSASAWSRPPRFFRDSALGVTEWFFSNHPHCSFAVHRYLPAPAWVFLKTVVMNRVSQVVPCCWSEPIPSITIMMGVAPLCPRVAVQILEDPCRPKPSLPGQLQHVAKPGGNRWPGTPQRIFTLAAVVPSNPILVSGYWWVRTKNPRTAVLVAATTLRERAQSGALFFCRLSESSHPYFLMVFPGDRCYVLWQRGCESILADLPGTVRPD